MHQHPRASAFDNERASLHGWQDRVRDPSLTLLLVLQVLLLFVALPLAAVGVPIAEPFACLALLVALTFVVVLSRRGVSIVTILLGLAAVAASGLYPGERFFSAFALGGQWSSVTASVLNHGGFILAFSALTWVVAHALYAPGRVTVRRLQGAVVVYLSLATIFANAFSLVWELIPGAYSNLPIRSARPERIRDDVLFQPRNADYHGLWRHRPAQSIRAQPCQFRVGYRAVLSRDYGGSPRDAVAQDGVTGATQFAAVTPVSRGLRYPSGLRRVTSLPTASPCYRRRLTERLSATAAPSGGLPPQ